MSIFSLSLNNITFLVIKQQSSGVCVFEFQQRFRHAIERAAVVIDRKSFVSLMKPITKKKTIFLLRLTLYVMSKKCMRTWTIYVTRPVTLKQIMSWVSTWLAINMSVVYMYRETIAKNNRRENITCMWMSRYRITSINYFSRKKWTPIGWNDNNSSDKNKRSLVFR